ncbi:NAD(P)/FAD-dependent oxidoreductase [Brevibacillus marinus]|uniref:NAD(P)/FAD-dependent oxidoreductase n=1 Tax=Brevibacillus marinus TaxID=2496837 RepID=UPI000F8404EC|nr:NAD(P)/FAD-dependent oxidoreductase [Brevibacillus marinus]
MCYDTIVIGGGMGGLQAAIQLGRSLHRVLVIDRQTGRSAIAKNYRNILGFPDGVSGPELRERGREQARRVGAEVVNGEVTALVRVSEEQFVATLRDSRQFQARTILLATGMTDALPQIPGLLECLGESVFICPDCDGYEVHQRPTLVIGSGEALLHMAERLRHYTQEQTLLVHALQEPAPDLRAKLAQSGFPWRWACVRRIKQCGGQLQAVVLASGERLPAQTAFLAFPGSRVNNELARSLDIAMLPNGHLLVDPRTKETSCRNVWAVGDLVAHSQMAAIAMGDGAQAAIWIAKRLHEKQSVTAAFD